MINDLEKYILEQVQEDIQTVERGLGIAYISTVNMSKDDILNFMSKAIAEQRTELNKLESQLRKARIALGLVIKQKP